MHLRSRKIARYNIAVLDELGRYPISVGLKVKEDSWRRRVCNSSSVIVKDNLCRNGSELVSATVLSFERLPGRGKNDHRFATRVNRVCYETRTKTEEGSDTAL